MTNSDGEAQWANTLKVSAKRSKLKFIFAVLHFLDDMQIDTAEMK
jgi:hypothetical protein